MANIKIRHIKEWDNYHFCGPFPAKILFDIDTDKSIVSLVKRFNDSATAIQSLLKDSLDNNEGFRAYGSSWSLSNIAHHSDRMLFNARLNIKKDIAENQLHSETKALAENLYLFQCGTTVKEISEYLSKKDKSLKTCGASN